MGITKSTILARYDAILVVWDGRDGVAGDDGAGTLAGHPDAAGEGADAGAVADGDPGNRFAAPGKEGDRRWKTQCMESLRVLKNSS